MSDGRPSVVLFGSGDVANGEGGSTIVEVLRASALGIVDVRVAAIVCNNSERLVPGFYERIADHNRRFGASVEIHTVNRARHPAGPGEQVDAGAQTLAEATACRDLLVSAGACLFVTIGFLKKIGRPVLDSVPGANTHPGPLANPKGVAGVDTKGLYGIAVQQAVLDRAYPYSAHTFHRVDADYDTGEVLAWRPVSVQPGDSADTLQYRVQVVEKACLPGDIEAYAHRLHEQRP